VGRIHVWAEFMCGQNSCVGRIHVWAEFMCGQNLLGGELEKLKTNAIEYSIPPWSLYGLKSFKMAPDQKKRKRPVPSSSQRSKKRQRISPAATTNSPSNVTKLSVALDALPWNKVEMPDMFEDAEGFYGLEEVEDVEVVREGNRIQFVRAFPRSKTVARVYADCQFITVVGQDTNES
jgi:hypothetical protein